MLKHSQKPGKRHSVKRWDILSGLLPHNRPIQFMEVGVWRGKMMSKLLNIFPLMNWTGVDVWAPPQSENSYATSGADISAKGASDFNAAFHEVVEIAAKYSNRTRIIKHDSASSADAFDDGSFDCVFIDGDHSYEGCKRDLLAWKSKAKSGGILSGHDYANSKGEVKRAVDEVIGKVELFDDHVWIKRIA